MTAAIVSRSRSAISRSICESSTALTESRPDVGSSRKSTFGSATSSRPTLTRLRWPPLTPRSNSSPILECWIFVRLSTYRTSMIFSRFWAAVQLAGRRVCAENVMFSSTVSWRCMTSSCGTKAMRLFHLARESQTSPLHLMVPEVFLTLPVTRFMMVVLPAPEAPMMAVDVPGANLPEGPRMMVVPSGKVRRMSSNSMRKPSVLSSAELTGTATPVSPPLSFSRSRDACRDSMTSW
mmetsp:Transcript_1084/g.3234  ORF Transcript_1084/g.3234 Transcript_1084/m.3234 type:complete len:236 (-) Transcript_1084:926-1633(-)